MTIIWKLFWLFAVVSCVFWYIGVAWYVAWKGTHDIKQMLRTLREKDKQTGQNNS